ATRADWIGGSSGEFARYHTEISGGAGASLTYEPGLPAAFTDSQDEPATNRSGGSESPALWADRIRAGLDRNRGRDIRRGFTSVGPHRDDLVVRAEVENGGPERDLRTFGSGGQKRTAAIALRLVEADSLRDASGREPVYLLDDVFAELDRDRAERVFRLLEDGRTGLVLLTAPKPSDMPFRDGGLARWRIRDGGLEDDG
ncbi:MAG: hypothetical protein ACWGON_05580, partial [Gemmatimonadota bacterium]